MDLTRYFSVKRHGQYHQGHSTDSGEVKDIQRGSLPFLANPINKDIREVLSNGSFDLEKANSATSTAGHTNTTSTFAGNGRTSRGNIIIYKQHHEAHTIELFYDLFFVANLAYFTAYHQHTDAESLINYLKLFTLMWFTWLSITLFDVRFSIDCVWNRLHKAIQFGVFTGFVFAGPVFDKYNNTNDAQSFKHFAIVLVVSRVAIAIQYAVVMWQGRMFHQTLVPLALSTAVHALAAVGHAITLTALPRGPVGLEEQMVWVTISVVEGLSIFAIAMIWRIVSFKYTHLVERLQLLTLIVIGEGIIGMVKSVACVIKSTSNSGSQEIGVIISSVLLLYGIYMLYFDQYSSDRFGTVRQQIWSIFHYPLHMAILLCVEGNTSLIVWNSAVQGLRWMWTLEPNDFSNPADGFGSHSEYIGHLNQTMYDINGKFKSMYWNTTYDWNRNFTAIANYTDAYGFRSEAWNSRTGEVIRYMMDRAQVFVFEAHSDSLAKLQAITTMTTTPRAKLEGVYDVFNVTVLQFYIGSGAVLLVLAVLYWFNKAHKTKLEFGEMVNRVLVGFSLIIGGIAAVLANKTTTGFKFEASNWIIAIVLFCFLIVLGLDNLLLAVSLKINRHKAVRQNKHWGGSTIHPDGSHIALVSKYPSGTNTPNPSMVPMSRAYTADGLYDSPPQAYDFAAARAHSHSRHPSRAASRNPSPRPGPHVATPAGMPDIHVNRATDDFSYENTPTDGLGIRSSSLYSVESRGDNNKIRATLVPEEPEVLLQRVQANTYPPPLGGAPAHLTNK